MMIADTDVLIDALRGKGAADRMRIEVATGRLATTTITTYELLSGARDDRARREIEKLLAALVRIPIDDAAAREAALIRRELEIAGTPLPTADVLIAGVCRSRSAMLITRNRKHFARVRDLKLASI